MAAGSGGGAEACASAGTVSSASAHATTSVRTQSAADERVLRDIGGARIEAGGAVGKVEAPAPQEFLVEALRTDRRCIRIEVGQPALQRLGVVVAEGERAFELEARRQRDVDEALG